MRKLRLLVIVLAALWLVGELAAVPIAERTIEQRVAERNRNAATVHADVSSFPLITRLLLTGRVNELSVTLDRVARRNLTFAEVRFDLAGIQMDRDGLLRRQARITAIDRGTVTATIDAGALSSAFGRVVALTGVRVSGRTLHVGPASVQIASDLFPCEPTARVEGERVVLSCTINEVPPALLEAAQR